MSRRSFHSSLVAVVALTALMSLASCVAAPGNIPTHSTSPRPMSSTVPGPTPTPIPTFDSRALSIDDATSLWVVVDKVRSLQPASFVPPDLVLPSVPHISSSASSVMRAEAATALQSMFAAAAAEGSGAMQIQNAYRSFVVQTNTHNSLVRSLGEATADAQSARPGYSEHQTGLAVDIAASPSRCDIQACFGETPQGIWLAANAYRFGFVLRYPPDKSAVTGYVYEPWHYRYVGAALATELHESGPTTLEEFFELPGAPDYDDE
ncbi:M15 family metallopeptidase [Frigoribacterium sp. UYMn621]|uniref:M15 family metallopeptidase n=1 Tax=Frigoribacterium sp. UYMn621 TaxID=3156343 RepID=UPI0033993FDC